MKRYCCWLKLNGQHFIILSMCESTSDYEVFYLLVNFEARNCLLRSNCLHRSPPHRPGLVLGASHSTRLKDLSLDLLLADRDCAQVVTPPAFEVYTIAKAAFDVVARQQLGYRSVLG